MEFGVLGPLRVLVAGEQVRLGGPRPRAVLGVLLAHVGESVTTGHLIDQVWGERPPPTALAALQVHVAGLRKVVGDRLVTTTSGYLVSATHDEVDAHRFEAAVTGVGRDDLLQRPRRSAEQLAEALSWWRGEAFADAPGGSDVRAARHRLTELRLSALEARLEAELMLGRHAHVVSELAGLVVEHPGREKLAGLHMLALYRCGRVTDARDAYQRLQGFLRADLGVEPGDEVAALSRAIALRDPTLEPPSTIPVPPSRFIGRRAELDRLTVELGRARLLTLTGPGGVGKTRLAAELARELAAEYPGGSELVELASLPAGHSVAERLAARFGLRADTEVALTSVLVDHFRGARALIVLDNCEHVLDGCARLAGDLLAECTGLRVVATSREPLGVAGEVVWPLNGLTTPAADTTDTADGRADALRLLIDRGAAARPGFTVAAGDAAVAGHLCRRLDGLPLAIELAAAHLRTRSLREVAELLDRRLDLVDSRSRTTPDRHRTMRAAIDWSHLLLPPEEQVLFRRLAVFADGCRLPVAEQVAAVSPDMLARLVDRSLLTIDSTADGTRVRMLELVREYAGERLAESREEPRIRREHALWCVEVAESAAAYGGRDHTELVRLLDAEQANLRVALEWFLGEGKDPVRALRIASPLWWYWWSRGLMADALGWLRRALAASDPAPSLLRGSALRAAAALSRNSGDYPAAAALGEECLAVYELLADTSGMISAFGGLCITALAQRDYAEALRFGERSRALAAELADQQRLASALNNIGLTQRCLGRLDEATATFTTALTHWRAAGDERGQAGSLGNLGIVARRRGDPATSRGLCLDSLRRYRSLDLTEGVLDMLAALACLEVAEGRRAAGLRLLEVTRRERTRLGAPVFVEDELADEAEARYLAETALGDAVASVIAEAAALSLGTAVDVLLA